MDTKPKGRIRRVIRLFLNTSLKASTNLAGTAAMAVIATLAGCTPLQDFAATAGTDLSPPRFMGISVEDAETVSVLLDKPASAVEPGIRITPDLGDLEISGDNNRLVIRSDQPSEPGQAYLLEGTVEDSRGNSLRFLVRFYGYNPRPPGVLINELNPRGSGNNPEIVELAVTADGNLGGLTLYNGTAGDWDSKMIFPAVEVSAGEFVLVHFRPQGIPEERDEVERKDLSGGLNASDTAWDFWVTQGGGLPTNNGVIALYDMPGGRVLDTVIYTNRNSASDERYLGFGSVKMLERVREMVRAGAWLIEGDDPRPEEMVDVTLSTATRSLNRSSDSINTNSRQDWHVAPTRGLTFGAINTDEVHAP